MIKDLIYDFDGTLSDTYPVVTRVFLDILREQGVTEDYDRAYADLKVSFGHAIDLAIAKYGLSIDRKHFGKLLNDRSSAAALAGEQKPFAEALDLLKSAAEQGKRNFIYTHSGKFVHDVIAAWGFTPYVTYTLDHSHGFPRKPDPTALLFLCEKFGIDPATAVMVGDRDIDVEVGHNAGMAGCLFDTGNYYPDCAAEYKVNDLSEIKKLF
ncbi:MAG: HAD-IA family hydrolase [Clostridia bacterium]|nr:HAD-IA family hydrolase [Clostridia bacterium]